MKITLQRTTPNYRRKLSTHRIMRDLTIGLLVIAAYSIYYYYYNFATNGPMVKAILIYVVSIAVALVTETIWALIHKNNVLEHLKNSFPLVTAIILALTLPVGTPLYVVGIASFIAIFFGKLVYGGFGQNIFNPALVGRVVVHLAYANDLIAAINSGFFSYVCHPDLFLNHIQTLTPEVEQIFEDIALAAKKENIPLEININGETNNKFLPLKYGCFHYPNINFFKTAKKIGCKFIFGVDAHAPFDFDKIQNIKYIISKFDFVKLYLLFSQHFLLI